MKKLFNVLRWILICLLASPFVLAWLPPVGALDTGLMPSYWHSLVASFQQLSITLVTTLLVAALITLVLGYLSILWPLFGKATASVLDAIESIPSILIALFCYAPVAATLAANTAAFSAFLSLSVFIFAATMTCLPEAVRGITLPLGELYHRKYSVSFRAYGFTKRRILLILLNSKDMREVIRRTAGGILLKTLVLDTSFSFIIQVGMGANGTPAHTSPGGLIAAFRNVLLEDKAGYSPAMFWVPVALLVVISLAFLLVLGKDKEDEL
jgi:hypothetical protein